MTKKHIILLLLAVSYSLNLNGAGNCKTLKSGINNCLANDQAAICLVTIDTRCVTQNSETCSSTDAYSKTKNTVNFPCEDGTNPDSCCIEVPKTTGCYEQQEYSCTEKMATSCTGTITAGVFEIDWSGSVTQEVWECKKKKVGLPDSLGAWTDYTQTGC